MVSPESSLFVPWYIFLVMFASSTAFALNALIEENRVRNAMYATEQSNAQLLNPYLQYHVKKGMEVEEQNQLPSSVELPTQRIAAPDGGKVEHYKHSKYQDYHQQPEKKRKEERKKAKDIQRDKAFEQKQQIDRCLRKKMTMPRRPSLGLSN